MRKKILITVILVTILLSVGCSKKESKPVEPTDTGVIQEQPTDNINKDKDSKKDSKEEEKLNAKHKDFLDGIASQKRVENINMRKVEHGGYTYSIEEDGSGSSDLYLFKTNKSTGEKENVFSKMGINITPKNLSGEINPINIIGDVLYIADEDGVIQSVDLNTWEVKELELQEGKTLEKVVSGGVMFSPRYIYFKPATRNILGDEHKRYNRMNYIGNNLETVIRDMQHIITLEGNKAYMLSAGYRSSEGLDKLLEEDKLVNKDKIRLVEPYNKVPRILKNRFNDFIQGEKLEFEELRLDYTKHLIYELDLETDEVKVIAQEAMPGSYIKLGNTFFVYYSPQGLQVVDLEGNTYETADRFSALYKLNNDKMLFEEIEELSDFILGGWSVNRVENTIYTSGYKTIDGKKNYEVFKVNTEGEIKSELKLAPGIDLKDMRINNEGVVYYQVFNPNDFVPTSWWYKNSEGKLVNAK